jgi:hypothetical protein
MNDPYRQSLDQELRHIREQAHDAFENPHDPRSQVFHNTLRKAEELNQSGHGLRGVHDTLKTAQRLLRESHNLPQNQWMMNPTHLTDFDHRIEHINLNMRNHPHFK